MSDIITVCTLSFGVWKKRYKECCRVLSPKGICQTITAGGGGGVEPKVIVEIKHNDNN